VFYLVGIVASSVVNFTEKLVSNMTFVMSSGTLKFDNSLRTERESSFEILSWCTSFIIIMIKCNDRWRRQRLLCKHAEINLPWPPTTRGQRLLARYTSPRRARHLDTPF